MVGVLAAAHAIGVALGSAQGRGYKEIRHAPQVFSVINSELLARPGEGMRT